MTAQDLRRAVVGYPTTTIRAAVGAVLEQDDLAALVTHYLTPADAPALPPPLSANIIAAIHRHLVASAN